ncbi:MAG TPA: PTS sugar transporter subunit IIB [Puia sp.]|jgi:mannose/fructose/N-acetylgalactosamine-specific phosphotransferase system component IIB|nr:PTS sugar transporter subunit IIB [Puia sp.]
MIKLTRIDDRLLHGQVAFTWTPALGADCLLIANDKASKDSFLKLTFGLAKPPGAQLQIKSLTETVAFLKDEKSAHLKILLLVTSVKDAAFLSGQVPEIKSINFGGIRGKEGSRLISKAVAITEDDVVLIKELLAGGIELEARQVPTDPKQLISTLI